MGVKLRAHLYLASRLRMVGAKPLLLCMASWRREEQFYFSYTEYGSKGFLQNVDDHLQGYTLSKFRSA
jgi:hypothetical protein